MNKTIASANRTFGDATTAFSVKSRLRKDRRNSILMTRQYPGMGSVSDWLKQISRAARTIRNTTHTWVLTRHQYRISALVSQTSFRGKTSGRVVECLLFSQARLLLTFPVINFLFCFLCLITAPFHCYFFRSGTFGSVVEYGCEKQISEHSRLAATMCIGLPIGVLLKVK